MQLVADYLVLFIVVAGLAAFLNSFLDPKSASGKGRLGEFQVRLAAWVYLREFHHFHDVELYDSRGHTQIDHIFVGPTGVFVVETKNYGGAIYGSQYSKVWTQVLWAGRRKIKHTFQNPIHQNFRHICALAEVCGLPKDKFTSVIAFANDANLMTDLPNHVRRNAGFAFYIRGHDQIRLSAEEVDHVLRTIHTQRIGTRRMEPGDPRLKRLRRREPRA